LIISVRGLPLLCDVSAVAEMMSGDGDGETGAADGGAGEVWQAPTTSAATVSVATMATVSCAVEVVVVARRCSRFQRATIRREQEQPVCALTCASNWL
jgi:hypothetical protein